METSYQKMKKAQGITGIYKELMEVQVKIDELQEYLNLLDKYTGTPDSIKKSKLVMKQLNIEKETILQRSFYCSICGHKLNREERIYCSVDSNWETSGYPMWDVYVCKNCEYFTWDINSRRNSGLDWADKVTQDPRYHGTMDGHPRFDDDHKKFLDKKILPDIEE